MSGLNKGIRKVEIGHLKWDPSAAGEPPTDLDIIAATYLAAATARRRSRLRGALRQPLAGRHHLPQP